MSIRIYTATMNPRICSCSHVCVQQIHKSVTHVHIGAWATADEKGPTIYEKGASPTLKGTCYR